MRDAHRTRMINGHRLAAVSALRGSRDKEVAAPRASGSPRGRPRGAQPLQVFLPAAYLRPDVFNAPVGVQKRALEPSPFPFLISQLAEIVNVLVLALPQLLDIFFYLPGTVLFHRPLLRNLRSPLINPRVLPPSHVNPAISRLSLTITEKAFPYIYAASPVSMAAAREIGLSPVPLSRPACPWPPSIKDRCKRDRAFSLFRDSFSPG